MRNFVFTLFAVLFYAGISFAQAVDSIPAPNPADTATASLHTYPDSNLIQEYLLWSNYRSKLTEGKKTVVYDIQQVAPSKKNATVFILLMTILVMLTYVKTAFSKDFDELIQAFMHKHVAQQIFRTQSREISFSSVLLHLNFIVAISLYVQFTLVKYFHVASLENFSSILAIIFLFTFFYLWKIITLKFIGAIFEVKEECDEYIFNFSNVCKTVGLTLIPALFIFYVAHEKYFNLIFIITTLLWAAFAIIFVWRGLSTGYRLLYRSMYHFFVYVCVVEISPIFLLFKLLTKTIH